MTFDLRWLTLVAAVFHAESPALAQFPIQTRDAYQAVTVPVAADLDGDGLNELVMQFTEGSSQPEGLYVFNWNGESAHPQNAPLHSTASAPSSGFAPVTIANLDLNLDDDEIIIRDSNGLRAIDGDGSILWDRPSIDFDRFNNSPVIAYDFDGDGRDEILYSYPYDMPGLKTILNMVDHDGKNMPGWPIELSLEDFGVGVHCITIANLGGNDVPEIVVVSSPVAEQSPHVMKGFDLRGNQVWDFPLRAVDVVAVAQGPGQVDRLYALEYTFRQDGRIRSTLSRFNGDTFVDQVVCDLGPDILHERIDKRGHTYRVTTVAWVGPAPIVSDALMVDASSNRVYFSATSLVRDFFWDGYNQPVESVRRAETQIFSFQAQSFAVSQGYPVHYEYAYEPRPFSYLDTSRLINTAIAEERPDMFSRRLLVQGDSHTLQTSTERRNAKWYRIVMFKKAVVLEESPGKETALFLPMVGGELHRLRLPTTDDWNTLSWPQYRQNAQRTGRLE